MSDSKRLLVRNTLWNVLGRLIGRFVSFLIIPYILFKIGKAQYAIFSLLAAFAQYASLSDLGTGSSLIRFMAVDAAKNDMPSLGKRVLGQVVFGVLLTAALATAMHYCGTFLLSLLRLPHADLRRLNDLLVVFVVSMGIGVITNAFGSVLLGYQRMDWSNALGLVSAIFNVLGTLFFLSRGWGLEGLVEVIFLNQLLGLILTILAVGHLCPGLRWTRHWPDRANFMETLRLGLQLQCLRVASTLSRNVEQIFLAPMLGLGAVTTYALASKPVLMAQDIGSLIVSATVPMVAQWDSAQDERRIGKLLAHSQRILGLFVAVSITGFWIFSAWFTQLWLGAGYHDVSPVMKFLAFGHLISLLTTPGVNELWGRGNLGLVLRIAAGQLAVYIVLCWLAIKALGLWGPGIALCLAASCGTGLFFILFRRVRDGMLRSKTLSVP